MVVKKNIIVVGGAHGGSNAVMKARQFNEHARIIMIEQAPLIASFGASLSYQLLNDDHQFDKSMIEQDQYFALRFQVDIRRDTEAIELDVDSRCLLVCRDQKIERLPFDSLIFAAGASSIGLDIPELYGPRLVNFRQRKDIKDIKRAVTEGAKHAVVIGCGFYGVEAALSLKNIGLQVTVIESKLRIMPKYSLHFAQTMLARLERVGISVRLNTVVSQAKRLNEQGFVLGLDDGGELEADLVVVCIGLKPRTALLAKAGAGLAPEGLIRVDDHLATTLPGIYACGSAISVPYAVSDERKWIPQPSIIQRTAQVAGRNASIDDGEALEKLKPFCGALLSEIGGSSFARTGLAEEQARELFGSDNILVTTVFGSTSEALEYPREMCIKLITERKSKKLVGAEVCGDTGVHRRIDLLSAAVMEGWPVSKLLDLDMAYSANASATFEPLKEAAFRASTESDNTKVLSPDSLALWLKDDRDFYLVDVGESPLFSGRIPKKAIHLPLESIRERFAELSNRESPIVLCSRSGHRSYLAQRALTQRGVKDVYHLDGGIASFDLLTSRI